MWNDRVAAFDMGPLCAQWFSDFLGTPLRLVRFDPDVRRLASREWTGEIEAPTAFQDGFPLLVVSTASLDELNRRLAEAGEAPVTMARFRPEPRALGTRAERRGPARRDRLRDRRGPGAPEVRQALHALPDPRCRSRDRRARAMRSATCSRPIAAIRAWAARHLRHERGDRRGRRPHARRRHGRARPPAPSAERTTVQRLEHLAAVRDLRRHLGHDVARDHVPDGRHAGRVRRRPALRPRRRDRAPRLPLARRVAARSALAEHAPLALQGIFLYGVSYVCVYHAERFVPRASSRSATRRRRCWPASAPRCSSARRSRGASSSAACSAWPAWR